ncbi:MAG: hypothetical protein KDB23_00150, partial [Planctomycetales bacterium]|nr:hypothetical protein [Planctomycetales bacterium]
FGFDWNHCVGLPDPTLPYRLLTRPTVPITLASLPNDVADYVSSNRLPFADFNTSMEILI